MLDISHTVALHVDTSVNEHTGQFLFCFQSAVSYFAPRESRHDIAECETVARFARWN